MSFDITLRDNGTSFDIALAEIAISVFVVNNQTNVVVTGTLFGASQGSGVVEIADNSNYASAVDITEQSVDTWSNTSIQIDIVNTNLADGTNYDFVTNDSAANKDPRLSRHLYTSVLLTAT